MPVDICNREAEQLRSLTQIHSVHVRAIAISSALSFIISFIIHCRHFVAIMRFLTYR